MIMKSESFVRFLYYCNGILKFAPLPLSLGYYSQDSVGGIITLAKSRNGNRSKLRIEVWYILIIINLYYPKKQVNKHIEDKRVGYA